MLVGDLPDWDRTAYCRIMQRLTDLTLVSTERTIREIASAHLCRRDQSVSAF